MVVGRQRSWALAVGLLFACAFACASATGCAGTRKLPFLGDGGDDGQLTFADAGPGADASWLPGDGPAPGSDATIAVSDGPQLTSDGPKPKPDAPGPPCPGGCDDGDPCTVDACKSNACVHTPKSCDDGDGCTSDSCDSKTGSCVHQPISCDDGDPCTIDGCKNNNCSYEKSPLVVYRFYNPGTGAHAFRTVQSPPPGFKIEMPVWRALPTSGAGRAKVYQQVRAANGDHMLSLNAAEGVACCGYQNSGDIAYGLTKKTGSSIPVYRLFQASSGLHLSSTSSTEGTQLGYKLEAATFYACPY